MNKIYRILESQDEFYIERYNEELITSGYLWWEKTTVKVHWRRVDIYGNNTSLYSISLRSFKTLKEAKDKVELFKKEIKYYY